MTNEETTMTPGCRHHWVLREPEGERIVGRCKRCDEVRIFSANGAEWEVPSEQNAALSGSPYADVQHAVSDARRWSA